MKENSNKKQKSISWLFIALLTLTIFSIQTLAIGVGPSRQTISFAPGQTIQGELVIINDAGENFKAAIYPQGDLSDIITIQTPLVTITPTESMKTIPYEIKFPTTHPKPGDHKLELVIRQFPPESNPDQGTVISATLAVISQIIIKVPYPGKFIEPKLYISNSDTLENPTTFGILVYNFGTEKIENTHAKIQVFNPAMEKVAELATQNMPVNAKEEAKLIAEWKPNVPKGTYKATATIQYDEKETTLSKDFNLGTFIIDVSDISVKKFRLGDVAKFDILLFNSWNTKLSDVYVEMLVEDTSGKKMTEFKTAAIELPAQQAATLEAYWYTEDVAPGVYKVKLIIHYSGKMTQKEYDFEVSTNSITKLGTIGAAISGSSDPNSIAIGQGTIIFLIIIVLVILIAMNFAWFYFLSKQLKDKGGQK